MEEGKASSSQRTLPKRKNMEGKKRLATLVGCNYTNTANELYGCINDVHAMHKVLLSRFGFDPTDIKVLTDAPGSSVLPTGANIRRALSAMIARAEPGDVLFFHYSGHGTLIPAVNPRHGNERDGEAIVPCDFNLITNVDFRQLVNRLPAGSSFTIISDSCHSGGLIDKGKEQIGPSSTSDCDCNINASNRPKTIAFESVIHHLASLSGVQSPLINDHLFQLFGAEASPKFLARSILSEEHMGPADEGILLSGCQANETSADMRPDEDDLDIDKAYGAFSNSIQMVLEKDNGLISNKELVMRAREMLHLQGLAQHPCLYCSDKNADAPFLGQTKEFDNNNSVTGQTEEIFDNNSVTGQTEEFDDDDSVTGQTDDSDEDYVIGQTDESDDNSDTLAW